MTQHTGQATIHPELLEMLVCPETMQRLRPATAQELDGLNARIRSGALRNRGGRVPDREFDGALVRADGKAAYPVDDGIPVMLVEESVWL